MRPLSRIWITRSRPGAEATAARVRQRGFEPVVQSVLQTQPIEGARLDLTGVDALAFTSGAAIAAFAALTPRRDLAVFAVGDATAALARAAGFAQVSSAAGDAADLAAAIAAAAGQPGLVLHPGALEPAADLVRLLGEAGVSARAVAVYHTVATALERVPDDVDAVLVHSPKAARRIAALVADGRRASIAAFALSPAVAEPLRQAGFASLAVAPEPNEASLLNLLGD